MYSQPPHHAINGFRMLAAGAALQVQLLAVSICLHKQTLVTLDADCHKRHADTHQPAVDRGRVMEGKGEGGTARGDAGTGDYLPQAQSNLTWHTKSNMKALDEHGLTVLNNHKYLAGTCPVQPSTNYDQQTLHVVINSERIQLSARLLKWRIHLRRHAIRRQRALALGWYLVHMERALPTSCHKILPIWADSLHPQMQEVCVTHLQLLVHALHTKHAS